MGTTNWMGKIRKPTKSAINGEPIIVEFTRFDNDRSLHASRVIGCCDCGLQHTFAFELFRASDKKFYLNVRAYRIPRESRRRK